MTDSVFLRKALLQNYKSIGFCDVTLAPLVFLVGPNGSGKNKLPRRAATRGGQLADVSRTRIQGARLHPRSPPRSSGHPTHFSVRLEYDLGAEGSGHYAFRIGARPAGGFEVQDEECVVRASFIAQDTLAQPTASFRVRSGEVTSTEGPAPAAVPDHLYLVSASSLKPFRPVYDALSRMGFYNLHPDAMRDVQLPDPGDLLKRDGSNIASLLAHLASTHPKMKQRIEEYLQAQGAWTSDGRRGPARSSLGDRAPGATRPRRAFPPALGP